MMMTGIGGSHNSTKDPNLLYSSIFKYSEGEMRKNPELVDSDIYHKQQQHNSGLMRYRSAPSSFLASLLDCNGGSIDGGGVNGGQSVGSEAFSYPRFSGPPDMETLRYGSGNSDCRKQEMEETTDTIEQNSGYSNGSSMIYQNTLPLNPLRSDSLNQMRMQNSVQSNNGRGNCSSLVRQSSSPAGFFANINLDNGYGVIKDMASTGVCDGRIGESSPSTSPLNKHINFTSSCSRMMPPVAETQNRNVGVSSPENQRLNMPNFPNNSWDDTYFSGQKRARNDDDNLFSGLNSWETQNGNPGKRTSGLTHHLSLPKLSAEMAAVEKYLQFQGSVPCKIRAKRGFATHPRSIAERVRRTRISERMRKLQELFPDMDKQTNTADMLDWAVEYIKDLQNQVQTLTETKVKCTCSSKQSKYSNSS